MENSDPGTSGLESVGVVQERSEEKQCEGKVKT